MNSLRNETQDRYHSVIHSHRKQFVEAPLGICELFELYILPLLPDSRDLRVLDVGAGDGGLLRALQKFGFTKIEGIDVSPDQVERAKYNNLPITLVDAFDHLPSRTAAYDVILLVDVIEHFSRERGFELVQLARESLRASGRIILHTINGYSPAWPRLYCGDLTHECLYSPKSLADMLLLANYCDVRSFNARPRNDWRLAKRGARGLAFSSQSLLWRVLESAYRAADLVSLGSTVGIYTPNFVCAGVKR